MKNGLTTILILVFALSFVGCENDDSIVAFDPAPATPQGVYSITGNHAVYIYWNGPYESDIAGYIVWRSLDSITNYAQIADVDAVDNPDLDLLIYEYIDNTAANGTTYYYAVSSYDNAGQLSELSAENVYDTPRPDGQVVLFEYAIEPSLSGYDFSAYATVAYDNVNADVYVDRVEGIYYINAADVDVDLQDMGYTSSFDEISVAPEDGWSENGWLELIAGHTYVIWTGDLHYAKMRVLSLNAYSVTFEWAYQTDQSNPELKPAVITAIKPVHSPDYLIKTVSSIDAM